MSDGPRNRPPFSGSGERSGRGGSGNRGGNRRDEGRHDTYGDRSPRYPRREQRAPNGNTTARRVVHYQVVMMDEEEWGDTLENRLNSLGHDGWRLVAIDEGRQYVFMQAD